MLYDLECMLLIISNTMYHVQTFYKYKNKSDFLISINEFVTVLPTN